MSAAISTDCPRQAYASLSSMVSWIGRRRGIPDGAGVLPILPGTVLRRIYNIGDNSLVQLLDYIGALERALGKTAEMELLSLQAGDVPDTDTYTDVADLVEQFHYKPATLVEDGISRFVAWCRDYFKV